MQEVLQVLREELLRMFKHGINKSVAQKNYSIAQ